MSSLASPRHIAAVVFLGLFAPVAAGLLGALGLTLTASVIIAVAISAIALAVVLKRWTPPAIDTRFAAVMFVAALLASARMWGLAVFMIEPARAGFKPREREAEVTSNRPRRILVRHRVTPVVTVCPN